MNTITLIVIAAVAVTLWFGIRWLVRSRSRYGGARTVTCPETKMPVMVEVDSLYTSLTSAAGHPDIRLENCSRWPLKEQCGQECLMSLDVVPESCLVSGVLMHWYRNKKCVFCQKAFDELHWADHRPALLSPDKKLLSWSEVHLSQLQNVLETHSPVCWDCYIAQDFRQAHPELVVFRRWRNEDARDSSASRHH